MAFREWSILTAHFVFSRADLFTRSVLATGRSVRMIVETFEVIERHSNEVFNPEIVIAHGLFKPDGNIPGQLEKSTTDTAKSTDTPRKCPDNHDCGTNPDTADIIPFKAKSNIRQEYTFKAKLIN